MNRKKILLTLIVLFGLVLNCLAFATDLQAEIQADDDDSFMVETGNVFTGTSLIRLQDETYNLWVGLRFQNITIPNTAHINNATLSVYTLTSELADLTASATIYGFDVSDMPALEDQADFMWPETTAYVNWNISAVTGIGQWHNVTVTGPVREIIAKYGWGSGNDLGLKILSPSGTAARLFTAHEYTNPARLYITYDENVTRPNLTFVENYRGFDIYYNQTGLIGFSENTIYSSAAISESFFQSTTSYVYQEIGFYDDDNEVFLLYYFLDTGEPAPDGLVYVTSSDYTTWATRLDAGFDLGTYEQWDITEHVDGSNDYDIVYCYSDDFRWRRQYLNASDVAILRGSHNIDYAADTTRPFSAVDLGGYSYGGVYENARSYYYQNDQTDGTWNTGWAADYISSTYIENDGFGLEDHEFLFISSRFDQYIRARFNDAVTGWGSYQYMTDSQQDCRMYDAALLSNYDVFVIGHDYNTADLVHFNIWDYSAEDWQTYDNFTLTGLLANCEPQISIDQANDLVYVVWFDDTNDAIKLVYTEDLGQVWSSEIEIANVSNIWKVASVPQVKTPAYVENGYLPVFFAEDDGGTKRLQVVGATLGIGETHYYVYDYNDDLVAYCFTDENTTKEWIDNTYPDPDDPEPETWEDYPITRSNFKLMLLAAGLVMILGPVFFMSYQRPGILALLIAIIIMTMGLGFLLHIAQF